MKPRKNKQADIRRRSRHIADKVNLIKDGRKKSTMETNNFCNCSNIAQLYQKNHLFPLRTT